MSGCGPRSSSSPVVDPGFRRGSGRWSPGSGSGVSGCRTLRSRSRRCVGRPGWSARWRCLARSVREGVSDWRSIVGAARALHAATAAWRGRSSWTDAPTRGRGRTGTPGPTPLGRLRPSCRGLVERLDAVPPPAGRPQLVHGDLTSNVLCCPTSRPRSSTSRRTGARRPTPRASSSPTRCAGTLHRPGSSTSSACRSRRSREGCSSAPDLRRLPTGPGRAQLLDDAQRTAGR